MCQKNLAVLGATGSIGASVLDLVAGNPDAFNVVALTGHQNMAQLAKLYVKHRPQVVVVPDEKAAQILKDLLSNHKEKLPDILIGETALDQVASLPAIDMVVAAIVGGAGLSSTLAAAAAGKTILLANKESLVMAGQLFMDVVKNGGACVLPIDSEHNAIFQCLGEGYQIGQTPDHVDHLILTASGGPFRQMPMAQIAQVTPEQACAHPKWSMGRKISVDSASMINKGLELIEACWLFALPETRVRICIHPQSLVHSFVAFEDGSLLAQLGEPDMRIPIAHALAWPKRIQTDTPKLDVLSMGVLEFEPPDELQFPCLRLARETAKVMGGASVVLNAANEIAVEAFLTKRIRFDQIAHTIEFVLNSLELSQVPSLPEIMALDQKARHHSLEYIGKFG